MVNDPVDMPVPWILTPTTKHCEFPGSNDLRDQEPGATLGGQALLGSSGGPVVNKNKSMQRDETEVPPVPSQKLHGSLAYL